jgi:DNA-binding winged helix-turn-helix (wHTH) protein
MVYRFGDLTLDEETRQLLSNEGERHLSPKAFELLTLLLARWPRALSKVELQERLWPATFVQETNIAGLVAEIRRALGDTASSPRFVRTVYRFGYRFVGEVTTNREEAQPGSLRSRPYLVFDDRQIMLMDGANVIGRAPDATIHIDSPGVSRSHARILIENGEATLEDLGSKNGTHLNGTRIAMPSPLSDGSEIRLGAVLLTFRTAPQISPTETVRS